MAIKPGQGTSRVFLIKGIEKVLSVCLLWIIGDTKLSEGAAAPEFIQAFFFN